ncbi:hypothetical protein MKEN_00030500 [Mycena kentingensis (nom. inval.)]|nr:hypothetical protein MKEN_00030500 [Mycena kentingensis (nom. inval.)]
MPRKPKDAATGGKRSRKCRPVTEHDLTLLVEDIARNWGNKARQSPKAYEDMFQRNEWARRRTANAWLRVYQDRKDQIDDRIAQFQQEKRLEVIVPLSKTQIAFTDADDQNLAQYLADVNPSGKRRMGQKLYLQLVADIRRPWTSTHSAESWRRHYVRRAKKIDALVDEIRNESGTEGGRRRKSYQSSDDYDSTPRRSARQHTRKAPQSHSEDSDDDEYISTSADDNATYRPRTPDAESEDESSGEKSCRPTRQSRFTRPPRVVSTDDEEDDSPSDGPAPSTSPENASRSRESSYNDASQQPDISAHDDDERRITRRTASQSANSGPVSAPRRVATTKPKRAGTPHPKSQAPRRNVEDEDDASLFGPDAMEHVVSPQLAQDAHASPATSYSFLIPAVPVSTATATYTKSTRGAQGPATRPVNERVNATASSSKTKLPPSAAMRQASVDRLGISSPPPTRPPPVNWGRLGLSPPEYRDSRSPARSRVSVAPSLSPSVLEVPSESSVPPSRSATPASNADTSDNPERLERQVEVMPDVDASLRDVGSQTLRGLARQSGLRIGVVVKVFKRCNDVKKTEVVTQKLGAATSPAAFRTPGIQLWLEDDDDELSKVDGEDLRQIGLQVIRGIGRSHEFSAERVLVEFMQRGDIVETEAAVAAMQEKVQVKAERMLEEMGV